MSGEMGSGGKIRKAKYERIWDRLRSKAAQGTARINNGVAHEPQFANHELKVEERSK